MQTRQLPRVAVILSLAMKPTTLRTMLAIGAVATLAVGAWSGFAQELPDAPPPTPPGDRQAAPVEPAEGDFEVQTRGPLHEAFAEQYKNDPEPGIIVTKEPPEAIEEVPPEQMPEGDNVVWIPGYWAWDDERNDFLWVSGVWRDIPPGERWVPGYWTPVEGGYQWVSGFWTSAEQQEVSYQPYPPESLEYGPTTAAPGDDHFWVPGCWCWIYRDADYYWRPGYWTPGYDDWVWIPARYHWTPYGAVYCDGYWDYRLARRGVLFAPVYFPTYGYYRFTPRVVVNVGPILVHLFVRPGYHHYYYGDYYGNAYANLGFRPWFAYYGGPRYYDPLLTYYTFRYGHDDFLHRVRGWHNFYAEHEDRRPPRTFRGQRDFLARLGDQRDDTARQALLASTLEEVVQDRDEETGWRFRQLGEEQRRQIASNTGERFRQLRDMRRQLEGRARAGNEAAAAEAARAGQDERGQLRDRLRLPELDRTRDQRPDAVEQPAQQPTPRTEATPQPDADQPRRQNRRPDIPGVETRPEGLVPQNQLPDRLRDLQNRFREEARQGRRQSARPDLQPQPDRPGPQVNPNTPQPDADQTPRRRPQQPNVQFPSQQPSGQRFRQQIPQTESPRALPQPSAPQIDLPKVNRRPPQTDAERSQRFRSFDRIMPNLPRGFEGRGRGNPEPQQPSAQPQQSPQGEGERRRRVEGIFNRGRAQQRDQ